MKRTGIILAVIAVLFAMCEEETNKTRIVEFSLSDESTYTFNVNRVASGPDVQFPHDTLQESDYMATEEIIQYQVSFPDNGQNVSLVTSTGTVAGELTNDSNTIKHYEINQGLFAGGRFIVWMNDSQLEAEYTVYGSGVPIIRSERGTLIRR